MSPSFSGTQHLHAVPRHIHVVHAWCHSHCPRRANPRKQHQHSVPRALPNTTMVGTKSSNQPIAVAQSDVCLDRSLSNVNPAPTSAYPHSPRIQTAIIPDSIHFRFLETAAAHQATMSPDASRLDKNVLYQQSCPGTPSTRTLSTDTRYQSARGPEMPPHKPTPDTLSLARERLPAISANCAPPNSHSLSTPGIHSPHH